MTANVLSPGFKPCLWEKDVMQCRFVERERKGGSPTTRTNFIPQLLQDCTGRVTRKAEESKHTHSKGSKGTPFPLCRSEKFQLPTTHRTGNHFFSVTAVQGKTDSSSLLYGSESSNFVNIIEDRDSTDAIKEIVRTYHFSRDF